MRGDAQSVVVERPGDLERRYCRHGARDQPAENLRLDRSEHLVPEILVQFFKRHVLEAPHHRVEDSFACESRQEQDRDGPASADVYDGRRHCVVSAREERARLLRREREIPGLQGNDFVRCCEASQSQAQRYPGADRDDPVFGPRDQKARQQIFACAMLEQMLEIFEDEDGVVAGQSPGFECCIDPETFVGLGSDRKLRTLQAQPRMRQTRRQRRQQTSREVRASFDETAIADGARAPLGNLMRQRRFAVACGRDQHDELWSDAPDAGEQMPPLEEILCLRSLHATLYQTSSSQARRRSCRVACFNLANRSSSVDITAFARSLMRLSRAKLLRELLI